MPLLFYKRYIQKASVFTLAFLSLFVSILLSLSTVGTAEAAPSAYLVGEGRGMCYTYYPNGFTGSGVKLNPAGVDCIGAGSTYAYQAFGNGEENSGGNDPDFGGFMQRTNKSNLEDLNDWRYLTDGQITQLRSGTDYTFLSRSDYDRERQEYEQSQQQEEAGNDAREEVVVAQLGPALEPLKGRFNSSCSGMPGEAECTNQAWNEAIYNCFQSSLSLEEDQTRGTPEQTEQNHKRKFANCLSGRLSGVDTNTVLQYLGDVSITSINQAANAAEQQANPGDGSGTDEETESSCGIEGVGWLICPVMSFLGSTADVAFNFLSSSFLEIRAAYLDNDSVRNAWSAMRNLANVAFVIAFMFIIYSQMTGGGFSNYGVKKMLPRLIIAAILVNLSFIICQLAVDISNLLGYSLKHLLDGGIVGINGDAGDGTNASANPFGIAVLVTGLIAGGITLALAVSMPVVIAAILALLLIVLILFARIALIVVLTVVAPLAFVAYLLPNTEQWFKKWYKMFSALLLVFPIIAVVFGVSSFASKVIYDAAAGNVMMQVVAVGVATIPLFVVPGLLKNSMSAAGAVGAKLAGMQSKANSRVGARVKDSSRLGEAQRGIKNRFALSRAGRRGKMSSRIGKTLGIKGLENGIDNTSFGRALGLDRGAAAATAAINEQDEKMVAQELTQFRSQYGVTGIGEAKDAMKAAVASGDSVKARAMQRYLINAGSPGVTALEEAYGSKEIGSMSKGMRKELAGDALAAGIKPKSAAIDKFSTSGDGADFKKIQESSSTYSGLNAVEIAGQKNLGSIIDNGNISKDMAASVLQSQAATDLLSGANRAKLERIAGQGVEPGSTPTTNTPETFARQARNADIPSSSNPVSITDADAIPAGWTQQSSGLIIPHDTSSASPTTIAPTGSASGQQATPSATVDVNDISTPVTRIEHDQFTNPQPVASAPAQPTSPVAQEGQSDTPTKGFTVKDKRAGARAAATPLTPEPSPEPSSAPPRPTITPDEQRNIDGLWK